MINSSSTFYTMLRNYSPLNEISSPQLKQYFSNYGQNVLNLFKKHYRAKYSNNPTLSLGIFFSELDNSLKDIKDIGIVQGWREYFNSQPQSVKSEFYKRTPKPVFLGKNLPSLNTFSQDNLFTGPVLPYINSKNVEAPINHINTGVPLPPYLKADLAQACSLLGRLQNKNLQSVMEQVSTNTKNHGSNLVSDTKHIERMGKVISNCTKKVLDTVGDAREFLLKAINFNPFGVSNYDISSSPVILEQVVEGQKTVILPTGLDAVANNNKPLKNFASPKQSNLA
jgi:hypothetical protein